ncbi:hypothetical protein [Streptomyces sp. NPDC101181]|uniref:hypothetical protein n=1 Tax=Streptomyces sp. NPDC101181 TaxID=3366125 RepID=UPI0037FEECB5
MNRPATASGSGPRAVLTSAGHLAATAAGASVGWWTGHVAPRFPATVLGLALSLWCLGSAWRCQGRARLPGFALDRSVRLATALSVHPVLALALAPLCLPFPPSAASRAGLTGEAADASRAIRRVLRVAVEPTGWPELTGWRMMPLLVRQHHRHASTVAAATTGASVWGRLRARLPVPAALLLSAAATLTLPGITLTEAQMVMLAVTVSTAAWDSPREGSRGESHAGHSSSGAKTVRS